MINICKDHRARNSTCDQCFENHIDRNLIMKEARSLKREVLSITQRKKKAAKKLKVLMMSIEKLGNGRVTSVLPSFYMKKNSTLEYYMNIKTHMSIFDVVRSRVDSVAYMLQNGLLLPLETCGCGKPLTLGQGDYEELLFICPCKRTYKLFERSIWEHINIPAEKILLFIFLWLMGLKDKHLRTLVSVAKPNAMILEGLLYDQISQHFIRTMGKLRGVVEIDESCFKHSTTSKSKTQPDKWVFGFFERERKRNYMEVVSKRTAGVLLPIIEKVCEPGTTIISDQWPAYNKLAEIGFPHYTVDHSRFFVNPNSREIHTQNIELSWCWAKFEIKRQNRKLTNLQKALHVYCWKRQFKNEDKTHELGSIIQEVCMIFKNYQMMMRNGKKE